MRNLRQAALAQVDALDPTCWQPPRSWCASRPSTIRPPAMSTRARSSSRAPARDGTRPEVYYLDTVSGLREHPSFWPGRDYSRRLNVVARRRGGSGGRSLVLSGHIDTVPLGLAPWTHDPFGAAVHDGKLYGLGSYDMKGGIVPTSA